MSALLLTYIAVPLAAAALMIPLNRLSRKIPDILSPLVMLYLLLQTAVLYFFRPYNFIIHFKPGDGVFPLGINLVLDGLSHLLLLAVTLVALAVTVYSIKYMVKYAGKEKYYTLYMLMLAGMFGVILAGDLFSLFIFMEVAAISTYALVAFGTKAEELEAALRYLIIGSVASLLILFGLSIIYGLTGTFNLAEIARTFPAGAVYAKEFVCALFLAGFGMKAALVPFHAWLPDAHTSAPTPVSATLSGVLIKVLGIYALVRILFNVLGITPPIAYVLMFLGAASILIGVILALGQWDFKRLLAYHSISQIGYVVLGLGLATPLGIMGGLFHLFNHALFKSLLFLNAGSVEYATGTRDLKKMGGLAKKMPVTSATSLVASLSIAGLPPFNGFWSKLFIIVACIQAGKFWFAFAAVVGSILTLSSFLKVQKYAFAGGGQKLEEQSGTVKEAPWLMGGAMVFLALLCLLIGLGFPLVIHYAINPAVVAVANGVGYGRMF
ncbi:MAG: proton-conducting transporter membrane subunit [Candidatus Margulisbacteria bacterium]|nr:proton-conducting transporter membrane subunit [Candidatus Margulisiibacteriota bacterium]